MHLANASVSTFDNAHISRYIPDFRVLPLKTTPLSKQHRAETNLRQNCLCCATPDPLKQIRAILPRKWEDLEGLEFEGGRHLEINYARGDLCVGSCTQGIGEVLCDWASQDHSMYLLFSD